MRFSEVLAFLPTVPMARPFQLFGKTFAVRLSSHLTVEPATFFWVLTGETFHQAAAQAGSNLFDVLRRGLVKKQQLTSTTLAPLREGLHSLLPPGMPKDASIFELLEALPDESAWALFMRGFGAHEGEGLCFLGQRFIELEGLCKDVKALVDQGRIAEAETLLVHHVGLPSPFWASKGIPDVRAHMPLDALFQVYAGWEASHWKPGLSMTGALSLLDPGKRPMGHWLRHQQRRAGCRSLQALADSALATDRTPVADYERMKAWSSGRDLLPPAKAEAIIETLGGDDTGVEWARYGWARLLSFLCEWVICATPSEAPTWSSAQALVAQRYRELLESAVSEKADGNQSSS